MTTAFTFWPAKTPLAGSSATDTVGGWFGLTVTVRLAGLLSRAEVSKALARNDSGSPAAGASGAVNSYANGATFTDLRKVSAVPSTR